MPTRGRQGVPCVILYHNVYVTVTGGDDDDDGGGDGDDDDKTTYTGGRMDNTPVWDTITVLMPQFRVQLVLAAAFLEQKTAVRRRCNTFVV